MNKKTIIIISIVAVAFAVASIIVYKKFIKKQPCKCGKDEKDCTCADSEKSSVDTQDSEKSSVDTQNSPEDELPSGTTAVIQPSFTTTVVKVDTSKLGRRIATL